MSASLRKFTRAGKAALATSYSRFDIFLHLVLKKCRSSALMRVVAIDCRNTVSAASLRKFAARAGKAALATSYSRFDII